MLDRTIYTETNTKVKKVKPLLPMLTYQEDTEVRPPPKVANTKFYF